MRSTAERLVEAARDAKAYGLAAAHIGDVVPIVVISPDGGVTPYETLYNPRIAEVSLETAKGEEGSVSLPGVRTEVERPVWAAIDYMNAEGEPRSKRFEGFAARIVLHEIEQTQGIFFLDRLSRLKRDMLLKKARKHPG